MSKKGGDSQTQRMEPWGPAEAYLKGGNVGGYTRPIYYTSQGKEGYGSRHPVGYETVGGTEVPGVLPESADLYDLTKGLSERQRQGFDMVEDYALSPELQGFVDESMGGMRMLTSGDVLSPDANPYLREVADAYARNVDRMLNETVFSDISDRYDTPGGFGSSSRESIERGIARRGAGERIADNTYRLYSDSYGRGLNAMTQGLSMAPRFAQFGAAPGQMLLSNEAAREASLWNPVTQYSDIVNTTAGQGGQQITPQSSGGMSSVLGGAATGAGIGSMMAPAGATGIAALGGPWPMMIGAGLGLLSS